MASAAFGFLASRETNFPTSPMSSARSASRTWSVGTLTYTAAGLAVLFAWLLWGDFVWWLKDKSVQPVLQLLLRRFGASDALTGLLLSSLPAVVTILLGPVVSYRSDRHRGRWGRRIPFLALATPVMVLAMVGLAFAPVLGAHLDALLGAASPGADRLVVLLLGWWWLVFECASISAALIFSALINDVVPVPFLGRFFGLFRAFSLIAGIVFHYWLLGRAENHSAWLFLGLGALYGIGFSAMCWRVREGEYPPPAADTTPAPGFAAAVQLYFRVCFRLPYYRWIFAAMGLSWMSLVVVNLFTVFFAKSVGMSMDDYGKYIALTFVISLSISYLLGWLADRFHPLRVGLVVIGLYALVLLAGGLWADDARRFALALVAHGVVSGTWWTTTSSLGQRLFPAANYAQFFSAQELVLAAGKIVVGPAVGLFLDATGHIYRYTFLIAAGFAVLGFAATWVVYRRFRQLGGPAHYVAP